MTITLNIILIGLFLSVSLIGYSVMSGAVRSVESHSEQLRSNAEQQLQGMFLFADTNRLLVLYVLAFIGIPIVLWLLDQSVFLIVVSLVILLVLPKIVLRRMAAKRSKSITEALPDALAQIAGAMRAGSTFPSALESMIAEQKGPLAQEFGLMLREQRMGATMEDALDNLGERVQSEELDLVISATMISQEVGGNLGEILQRLSETIRRKMEMEGKIKALTAQGVLQGIVVTLLPFIILMVLMFAEPDAMKPIFSSLLGWVFLFVICVLEVVGGLMIKKVVSIDI